jgi:hypothetical protein
MAKQSAVDKVIQSLEADIHEHEREIAGKQMLISRLRGHMPVKKAKPREVKPRVVKVDEKTA